MNKGLGLYNFKKCETVAAKNCRQQRRKTARTNYKKHSLSRFYPTKMSEEMKDWAYMWGAKVRAYVCLL